MLIGLTGAAGAGKDSAAAVLSSVGWRSIAFADALRWECADHWAVDPAIFSARSTKEAPTPQLCAGNAENANWLRWAAVNGISLLEPRSPRWVLQNWGTFRRSANPDHWVQQVVYWARYQQGNGHKNLVVTDVRYPNEAAAVRTLGGHLVRVHRIDVDQLPADTASHDSERHGDIAVDADIHNDGTLFALHAEVLRVVQQLQAAQAGADA